MKHAFLILAHNNWWQLKKLIESIDSEAHDIYVHIDKKSIGFDESYFTDATTKSELRFYKEVEVYWGGFSIVLAELYLMKKAYDVHYDYYHIISGADLPLKSNREIDKFFEKNIGKEFVYYDDKSLKENPEISRRTKYYHFLQNYRRKYQQNWKNKLFTILEKGSLSIQMILNIDRVKNIDWTIKYGSNWVSITDDLVKVILKNEMKIRKVFSHTSCADELFIQTIAYNEGFRGNIYQSSENQMSNVRYVDWSRGKNGNPYTFTIADKNLLLRMGEKNLFARKFSETVDKDIIEFIYQIIRDYEEKSLDKISYNEK